MAWISANTFLQWVTVCFLIYVCTVPLTMMMRQSTPRSGCFFFFFTQKLKSIGSVLTIRLFLSKMCPCQNRESSSHWIRRSLFSYQCYFFKEESIAACCASPQKKIKKKNNQITLQPGEYIPNIDAHHSTIIPEKAENSRRDVFNSRHM